MRSSARCGIFYRDGFVVVDNLLTLDQLETWRAAGARVLKQILAIKGEGGRKYITETKRLPHRYSYGTASASRELLHEPEWAAMIDLPTTTPILSAIFGTPDYFVRGAGGDLCLPGAIEYQGLHADTRDPFVISEARRKTAEDIGIALKMIPGTNELDAATTGLILERTPPHVTINFLMSDFTYENGPDPANPRHAGARAEAAAAGRRTGVDAIVDACRRQGRGRGDP